MGHTSGFNKESVVERVIRFWNFTLVPAVLTAYYICRYGVKGAEREVNKRLVEAREEVENVIKNQKR